MACAILVWVPDPTSGLSERLETATAWKRPIATPSHVRPFRSWRPIRFPAPHVNGFRRQEHLRESSHPGITLARMPFSDENHDPGKLGGTDHEMQRGYQF